jgi:SMI1-KNR4 cell-wall
MISMIMDWKTEIAIAWLVQKRTQQLDHDRLWDYHRPRVAASDSEITGAESILGHRLDSQYRTFLTHANGWPDFYHSVDLFGTGELCGGSLLNCANDMLREYPGEVWRELKLAPDDVFPIAKSKDDIDLFVIVRPSHTRSGEVVWLAGSHVETFATFDQFFLSMVDYNRLRLTRLEERTNKT